MSKCLYCEEEITPDQESFSKNGTPYIHRECFKVNESPCDKRAMKQVIGSVHFKGYGIHRVVSNVVNRNRM